MKKERKKREERKKERRKERNYTQMLKQEQQRESKGSQNDDERSCRGCSHARIILGDDKSTGVIAVTKDVFVKDKFGLGRLKLVIEHIVLEKAFRGHRVVHAKNVVFFISEHENVHFLFRIVRVVDGAVLVVEGTFRGINECPFLLEGLKSLVEAVVRLLFFQHDIFCLRHAVISTGIISNKNLVSVGVFQPLISTDQDLLDKTGFRNVDSVDALATDKDVVCLLLTKFRTGSINGLSYREAAGKLGGREIDVDGDVISPLNGIPPHLCQIHANSTTLSVTNAENKSNKCYKL